MSSPVHGPVLVVEDDDDIRGLLRHQLDRWPWEVAEAASGEAALELARANRPALVLLDIMLPGIDGWEVLRRLRVDPDLADVPVIIVSIVDDPGEHERPPVQGYLSKPFHKGDVDRLLGDVFGVDAAPGAVDGSSGGP
jgi:CheY-like chemotaxis protein